MRPGCSMRLSTAPRLSASVNSSVRRHSSSAAASPPASRIETIPPKADIWRAAMSWPGWSGQARVEHLGDGRVVGQAARRSAAALSLWRSMRSCSVRGAAVHEVAVERARAPRRRRSGGSRCARPARRRSWRRSRRPRRCGRRGTWWWSARRRRRRAPAGCCSAGVAKVLSTTTIAPCSWASALIASMSTMRSHGLLGVSIHTIRVPGCPRGRDRVEVGRGRRCRRPGRPGRAPGRRGGWCRRRRRRAGARGRPAPSRRSSASSAARPEANANPSTAPSSTARWVSSAVRVGLPLRAYS